MMLISPGKVVVAQEPSAKLRLQAIPMECELPVQPWPDSFGWAGYTNAILENGAALAEAPGDNAGSMPQVWLYQILAKKATC